MQNKEEYPWSLTIKPKTFPIKHGFEIWIHEEKPCAPNYNLPMELNKPDYYFAANTEELLEFLRGIYSEY